MSLAEKAFILRLAVSVLCGWIALELWRIAKVIQSPRLKKATVKILVAFAILAVARLIANFADNYFEFGIGIFSNVVNFAFYGSLIYLFYKYRKIFEQSEIDTAGKKKVSRIFEDLLDEMKIENNRLTELQQNN